MAQQQATTPERAKRGFDVEAVRLRFPILNRMVHGRPLVYLDTAATAQKPDAVIEAVAEYYRRHNANVHRGVHALSQEATEAFEAARRTAARFLGAEGTESVIFTRGTTEGVNLVAQSFARPRLRPGDEILLTEMEHHSNIVPWQMVAEQTGAVIRVVPVTDRGELDMDAFASMLSARTKVVSMVHVSNALGTINPVEEAVALAKAQGAVVMIDGAQAAPHVRVNVAEIGCDFYAMSAHKAYGPTGAGVLVGRRALLEEMEPWQGGGDMIESVSFAKTTWNRLPHKFEAGTPNIAGVIGMGAALEFLESLDREGAAAHEDGLVRLAHERLGEIAGMRFVGTAARKTGAVSFVIEGLHPHDLGTVMDSFGVAIRTGHHCTQPLMERFGVPATARASFGVYNTAEEVEALAEALRRTIEVLR